MVGKGMTKAKVVTAAVGAGIGVTAANVTGHGACLASWGVAGAALAALLARPCGSALVGWLEAAADRADPGGSSRFGHLD